MPDTPSSTELMALRDEVAGWMPDRCNILRVTQAEDSAGGVEDTETQVASAVLCEVQSGVAQEQVHLVGGRLENVQLFTITFPALTDVRVSDHLLITTQANRHLIVQAVVAPESWEIERRVIATTEGPES